MAQGHSTLFAGLAWSRICFTEWLVAGIFPKQRVGICLSAATAHRGCNIPSRQHECSTSEGRLMPHVAEKWCMTRWMSSVNTVWACVVGTVLPFIFVLLNTSLNDLFHLWNGYLVETARFNSLWGKTQKNFKSTCLLRCERNPFGAPHGLLKNIYSACFLRFNACQVKIIWSIPLQTTQFEILYMPTNGRRWAKV